MDTINRQYYLYLSLFSSNIYILCRCCCGWFWRSCLKKTEARKYQTFILLQHLQSLYLLQLPLKCRRYLKWKVCFLIAGDLDWRSYYQQNTLLLSCSVVYPELTWQYLHSYLFTNKLVFEVQKKGQDIVLSSSKKMLKSLLLCGQI